MENVEIAHVLSKYADLLEIEGEDLFRVIMNWVQNVQAIQSVQNFGTIGTN
jgi:DNA polymerase/3'-5' exonuclease PolX